MRKSALFGIAALGMAAVGVPHAFATIEVTLNGHIIGISTPNSFASSSSYGGFSWTGTAVNESVTSSGAYQLSFTINGLATTNSGVATANFQAWDNSITLPTGVGINQIQGDVTANVTNGTSSESVSSGGQLNPATSGGSTMLPTINFVSSPGLEAYSGTGPMMATSASNNMGTIELLTSDSVALSRSTMVNSVNSVIIASTTVVTTPEPATLALFALGGLALLVGARRRGNKA